MGAKTFQDKCTKPEISLSFLWTTSNSAEGNNLQLIKEFVGCFSPSFFPLLSPSPPTKKKGGGRNYLRRWRCSQTIILTYSNNRNLQNSNHNSRDRRGINQSCRFNSILNIDEMCFGSLTLVWQGQGSRLEAPGRWREGWGTAAGRRGFCDSNWWLSGQVESERGSEEGC